MRGLPHVGEVALVLPAVIRAIQPGGGLPPTSSSRAGFWGCVLSPRLQLQEGSMQPGRAVWQGLQPSVISLSLLPKLLAWR